MTPQSTVGVGIIGMGRRGQSLGARIAETARETGLRVTAICNRNRQRLDEAGAKLEAAFRAQGVDAAPARHREFGRVIDDPNVDVVMITTPQYAHRESAVPALGSGKWVYLDKPIAHNLEDAIAIHEAAAEAARPVLMGFTRRYEAPWRQVDALVRDGAIGELAMMQIRTVVPYHVYFHTWHRRREWSGGALNDKSSHHFDVFNWFARARAEKIAGFGGRRVYLPDGNSPVRCRECDRECPYRVTASRTGKGQDELADLGDGSWANETDEKRRDDNCVYLPGADNNDHAVIQLSYANGVVGSLFWCIFGPRSDDQEQFELVGSSGRLILNRHTGEIDLIGHFGDRRETIDCTSDEFSSSHFGSDLELVREMRRWVNGAEPVVGVRDGLEATRLVMAAHQSIDSGGELVRMSDVAGAEGKAQRHKDT